MSRRTTTLVRLFAALAGLGIGYVLTAGDGGDAIAGADGEEPRHEVNSVESVSARWEEAELALGVSGRDAKLALADEVSFDEIEALVLQLDLPYDFEIAKDLLQRLATHDGERAFRLLESLELPEKFGYRIEPRSQMGWNTSYARRLVLMEWTRKNPDQALESFDEWSLTKMKSSTSVTHGLRAIIETVAETDHERALEIASERGLGDWFERSILGDLGDPEAVARLLKKAETVGEGRETGEFLNRLMSRASIDPDGTMAILQSLPHAFDTSGLFGRVNYFYSPEQSVQLFGQLEADALESDDWSKLGVDGYRDHSPSGLHSWAARDPQAAVAWADALPENAREHFRAMALVGAAANDPEWAVAEIESLSGEKRGQAMLAIARNWFDRDTAGATEWIDSVQDSELQSQLRERVGL